MEKYTSTGTDVKILQLSVDTLLEETRGALHYRDQGTEYFNESDFAQIALYVALKNYQQYYL